MIVVVGELSLPQHGTAVVGQVHRLDALNGAVESVGIDVALVAIAARGKTTDEELSISDTLAPVLNSLVETRLSDVAFAVVVKLDPDVVELLADIKRLRSVGEGALGSGSEVVLLAAVVGEVALEALNHGKVAVRVARLVVKVDTVELDIAKGAELRVVGTTKEQVPDLVGNVFTILVALKRDISIVVSTAHTEDNELAIALASFDGVNNRRSVLQASGTSILLGLSGIPEASHVNGREAAARMEVVEESKVDNIVGRVVAHALERSVVIFGSPVDGELAAGGARGGQSRGDGGHEASKEGVANKHCVCTSVSS